ncbi:hypothetical protein NPS70_03415 [Streptomyces sp. C10-9-1]|uniref:hypothetical protein n=1 Tax=Streptomyces sp. C10-9-1 TaxID=1859285 RepID=UPI0021112215|nr:hypothetical protein [Streptomyces sp. C10-9-1]MCQ6552252.1 hypothetical protein [Streptomyces sp. C10-9-1]
MTSVLRGRVVPLAVLFVAVPALVASLVWAVGGDARRSEPPPPAGAVSGLGPVHDLAGAEAAAERFADRWDLHVGEVMRFTDGYYAQLVDAKGKGATEVLVEPGSGTVHPEFGPAMSWNTEYGMMPRRVEPGATTLGPGQAVRIADRWLREHRPALRAADPVEFPGYYTLHTLRGDRIEGMLSVNSVSGRVWYHTWHGRFLELSGHSPAPGAP